MSIASPVPRRVLMTADAVGGVWTYALGLARALGERGIAVELAVLGPAPGEAQRRDAAAIASLTLHAAAFRLEWMADPWEDVERARDWLAELCDRTRPDLLHLNTYAHATAPWPRPLPLLAVAHSCVCSWWRAVKGDEAPPEWDRYRREIGEGLRAADLVVAPTRAMLRQLERHYGALGRARVIANAGDPGDFTPSCLKRPEALSAGRLWDEAKNLAALDRAAARIRWPVLVAGDPRHPDGGEARAANVRLLGPLDRAEMAASYARASIYCLPARYEPFGLSVLEAALSGCALALGDIDTLRELWDGAALFVDPGDDGAIAHAVNRLADDAALRGRLATAARRRALALTPSRMAEAYVDAYASILNARSPACAS